MAGTNRLALYQSALLLCGERFLASLTENVESRRLLDNVWNEQNAVQYCLEQGMWQFAMRTDKIDNDPSVETQFGYRYAFDKDTDWVNTAAICSDEYFTTPLTRFADETVYWFADITPIFVKYVSNSTQYGYNLGIWPQTFSDYVSAFLSSRIIAKLTSDERRLDYILNPKTGMLAQKLALAKSKACMTQPTQFPAIGTWVRSRRGLGRGWGPLGDGGLGGQLIGP